MTKRRLTELWAPIRVLAILAAISVATLQLAANCGPTEPACNDTGCPDGQVRVGIECAPAKNPQEECTPGVDVCLPAPNGQVHACSEITQICTPGLTIFEPCAFSSDLCGYVGGPQRETYCGCGNLSDPLTQLCAFYRQLGDDCDTSFGEFGCETCERGLLCSGGRCIQPCETADECPCDPDTGDTRYTCDADVSSDTGGDRCVICRGFNEACDGETDACCEDGQKCGDSGRCCKDREQDCVSNTECCDTDVCRDGTCEACTPKGQSCGSANDCCGGLTCLNGQCAQPCTPGEECTISDNAGPCAEGRRVCDNVNGGSCEQVVFPETETCDGEDNDCNGDVDDIEPTDCEDATPSGCQSGFTVTGKTKCQNGEEICEAVRCDSDDGILEDCYCDTADAAPGLLGQPCGNPSATPCTPGVDACIPNSVCQAENSNPNSARRCLQNPNCAQPPQCWTPDDVTPFAVCYSN